MSKRTKARTTLFSGLALLAFAAVAVPAVLRDGDGDVGAKGGEEPLPVPVSTPEAAVLWRCGLDPQALCAAGLTSGEAGSVAQRALAYLAQHPTTLSSSDADYAAARVESDALVRKVKSGLASQQEVVSCQGAASALETAQAAREAAIAGLVADAQAGLSVQKAARLATIRGNRARWRLPLQYLVEDREDAAWLELRDALDNERISADYGEEPDAALQAHLATEKAKSDVAAAKASLDASLGAVITAWNTALTE